MKIRDIVELIDENMYDGKYRGRMTFIGFNLAYEDVVICEHPDHADYMECLEDELVVMEEADD